MGTCVVRFPGSGAIEADCLVGKRCTGKKAAEPEPYRNGKSQALGASIEGGENFIARKALWMTSAREDKVGSHAPGKNPVSGAEAPRGEVVCLQKARIGTAHFPVLPKYPCAAAVRVLAQLSLG